MNRARGKRRRLGAALLWLLVCCGGGRCHGCTGDASLAELIEIHGRGVERDFHGQVGRWRTAQVGDRFELGDGLRAAGNAYAIVELKDGSLVRLQPGTVLRFLKATEHPAEHGLDVQSGEAEISVGATDMRLRTQLGLAVLERGSRIVLRRAGPERIVYRVELGSARLERPRGGAELVGSGELVEIGIGMAVLERHPMNTKIAASEGKPAPAPAPATGSESGSEAEAESGSEAEAESGSGSGSESASGSGSGSESAKAIAGLGAGPERVSVGAAAGESFTVHAARLPVAVAFELGGRCPGEAVLVLDRKPRARGREQVSATLGAGRYGYELRCVTADGGIAPEPIASGHVVALRDPGNAPLPRRPPTSSVDADGKRYTVLFQNLLPNIELRWPGAPQSGSYTVHVDSDSGKAGERKARKPELVFPAGALREGVHRLHFSTQEGARSKITTLEIRFDNAAPRASLTQPRDRSFAPGSSVEVAGVALPGYRVSLPGGSIALDGQYRFSGSAATTQARPDIALRIESPRGGVHYYVRRAASAP